ncbi:AzlD domain-containing protein [Photobacterium angustum]|uniref:Branched-chain amino acid ABC transporter n=1 Tax=Photobacterium angustum TaxID=661 RepID=A0A2S7VY09_PHOAN|nr:AzlD domain-containing protein [Photobacterium angustum]PQJ66997.1 hypothetical protein BTO08_06060 [Photobacterium angustum]
MSLNIELIIVLMAAITFSCRYIFFMKCFPVRLNHTTKKILEFTAPSVLTAMWVPIVFLGHKTTENSLLTSPFLYAGLITLLAAYKLESTLNIVVVGMSTFVVISWLI